MRTHFTAAVSSYSLPFHSTDKLLSELYSLEVCVSSALLASGCSVLDISQPTMEFHPLPPSEPGIFERLRSQCLINGKLYEDPDFPAIEKSLFYSQKPPAQFVWKRPPEICQKLGKEAKLFVAGGSRFDVSQGILGDCWLVAAISSLALDEQLLHRVVPTDQGFSEADKYAGIFRFYFWRFGRFQEVVIDDRLPTHNGKLVFMHSDESNEFWSALFEKAYAKLHGSYEALKGGKAAEAMVDFTGGITEAYKLSEAPADLFKIMAKANQRNSMMSCSITAVSKASVEAKLDNGLIKGHAYSVTAVRRLKLSRFGGAKMCLVRIRNPWGNEHEWNGAWSDNSDEWKQISASERKEIGLTFEDDGESWMSYEDFIKNFTDLEICNLSIDSLDDENDDGMRFNEYAAAGQWSGETAGGCRNFDTFANNPQFFFTVDDPDDPDDPDDDDKCSVLIGLMQKGRREQKHLGVEDLCIGFSVYKLEGEDEKLTKMTKDYVDYHRSFATSGVFTNAREVHARMELTEGRYCLMPCAFNPGDEGEFLMRMYTEKPPKSAPEAPGQSEKEATASAALVSRMKTMFERLAGADGVIDATELQDLLTVSLRRELAGATFSLETCRSIIAVTDINKNGTLDFDEFKEVTLLIRSWKTTFQKYDRGQKGYLDKRHLSDALIGMGLPRLSSPTLGTLIRRFSKNGRVYIDDFILCSVRVKGLSGVFDKHKGAHGKASLSLDEFLTLSLDS